MVSSRMTVGDRPEGAVAPAREKSSSSRVLRVFVLRIELVVGLRFVCHTEEFGPFVSVRAVYILYVLQ